MRPIDVFHFAGNFVKEASGVNLVRTVDKYYPEPRRLKRMRRSAGLIAGKFVFPETAATLERFVLDEHETPDRTTSGIMDTIDVGTAIVTDLATWVAPSIIVNRPLPQYTLAEQAEAMFGGKIIFNLLLAFYNTIARQNSPIEGNQH